MFGRGKGCETCELRGPFDLSIEVTDTLGALKLNMDNAVIKAFVVDVTGDDDTDEHQNEEEDGDVSDEAENEGDDTEIQLADLKAISDCGVDFPEPRLVGPMFSRGKDLVEGVEPSSDVSEMQAWLEFYGYYKVTRK